jgi:hypothetical protein
MALRINHKTIKIQKKNERGIIRVGIGVEPEIKGVRLGI